jgi:hypothetical protein
MLVAPILERAHSLLRLALARNGAPDGRLPWGFLDNRPPLRLLASLVYLRIGQQRTSEARELAQWMVLTLNPNDNHGLREELTRLCLEAGDAQGALDVCDRFPDDAMVSTMFDRALALFVLGRVHEAEVDLRTAAQLRPKVMPMLKASDPRRPRSEGGFLRVGGNEEAWLYRETHHALWEKSGALAWARAIEPRKRSLR